MSSGKAVQYRLYVFAITFILIIILMYFQFSTKLHRHFSHKRRIERHLKKGIFSNTLLTDYSQNWLLSHASQLADEPPAQLPANFDAFSKTSGISIWDMYPPTLSCPDLQRIGPVGEGGKWICGLSYLAQLPKCVVYSFGLSNDIRFEVEILMKTQCTIFAFDPTIGQLPYQNLPPHVSQSLTAAMRQRMIFHKVALGTSTGSSAEHSLTEQLYDVMARCKHSFIHLLKMDIEGAEWSVFSHLSTVPHSKLIHTIPVGQISIELHYISNDKTADFFQIMHQAGLHPFSREINLIPCLTGQDPFAVEYSFIHPQLFYGYNSTALPVPIPSTLLYISPVKAVIYFLSMKSRVHFLTSALLGLYQYHWQFFPDYPVIVFHDDMPSSMIEQVQQAFSHMPVRFVQVFFSVPEVLKRKNVPIPDYTVCDPKLSTIGYRHMCRFHAFLAQDYLSELSLAGFDYILRLDDDSRFDHPIGYDWFRYMHINQKMYGFVSTMPDDVNCVTNLWETAKDFVKKAEIDVANFSFFYNWHDPLVFYNNFEISHRSLWQSSTWKKFREYIDELGGIYTLRWGDAPLHTLGVTMQLKPAQIHAFSDIPYVHGPFIKQVPTGLPMPSSDPLQKGRQCTFFDKWICHGLSTNGYVNSTDFHYIFTEGSAKRKQTHYDNIAKTQRGAMFTFAHEGREDVLVSSVFSFFSHYSITFPTPFVIFYDIKGKFDAEKVQKRLNTGLIRPLVFFFPVQLVDMDEHFIGPYCFGDDAEAQAVSLFLNYQVFEILKAQGYEWFFRFPDDSSLLSLISYNIFDRMKSQGKLYGYGTTALGKKICTDEVWKVGAEICTILSNYPSPIPKCSKLFLQWPQSMLFASSFEISHVSVWDSFIARSLFHSLGEQISDDVLSSSNHPAQSKGYLDSSLHTLCVVMSLEAEQVLALTDLQFKFRPNALVLQGEEKDHRIETDTFIVDSVHMLDSLFSAQKVGWLGGDIATSLSTGSDRIIWLFGDSLLGISTSDRRVEEYSTIVPNTVAVTSLHPSSLTPSSSSPVRDIKSHRYYWRTSSDGSPLPIFSLNTSISLCSVEDSMPALWPTAGITINSTDGLKLLVISHVSCGQESSMKTLNFLSEHTAFIVVTNPLDPPDTWLYSSHLLQSKTEGIYRWMSVVQAQGESYANAQDTVYLLGSYQPVRSAVTLHGYQVMGKISAADLLSFRLDGLEVATGPGSWSSWMQSAAAASTSARAPLSLFGPLLTEASLWREEGEWFVLSLHMMEHNLQLCRAQEVTGQWKCSYIAEIEQQHRDPRLITYAGKSHPGLLHSLSERSMTSSSGLRLLVSVVSNTLQGPAKLFEIENKDVYTPKFMYLQQRTENKGR